MNMSFETRDGGAILRVNGSMTIYEAARIREVLLDGLGESDDLTIDLEGLENVDITGIQLIVAARKSARRKGKQIALTGIPQRFHDVLMQAGLDPEKFFQMDRET